MCVDDLATYEHNVSFTASILLSRDGHPSSSLRQNLLASADMIGVGSSLALHTAVSINMTITATLRRHINLVWAGWVCAGLGTPITA